MPVGTKAAYMEIPPGGRDHVPGGWVAVVCQGGHMTRAQLDKRPGDVAAMFDKVAPRYDLLNDVLSLGQDRWWRKVVAKAVSAGRARWSSTSRRAPGPRR